MFKGLYEPNLDIALREPRLRRVASRPAYLAAKRGLDLLAVFLLAPVAVPLVGGLALLVRTDGAGAFYGQRRIGRGGRLFTMWKLRSMVPDAERRLEQHLARDPAARAEWDADQKLKDDPRITRVGRLLRKYSLDELPQLWNVFTGDMSLVGPRPMFAEQRALYPGTAYYELRPGMTGLWQISDRNGCTFAERAKHDTRYADIMSFATDLRILAMTPLVVFRGTGL
ncbi:sugar transferase [Aquamicrobium sp. LC103]|uniref:sugar transferase n=1 Tax=Aquamicrobium sp. LC103 TaxID=1120658 RepID=UPI0009E1FE66|nr:sugar transferase [Aquamicrobium sp. LC103]TKT80281.1 sugar transferase [Aquamicrobium sp. LC103]